MTQHEKILQMHSDGRWHCQAEYHALYIFSPHKRREEIEKHEANCALKNLNYFFQDRPCEHGIQNSRDYLLVTTFAAPEKKQKDPVESHQSVLI